MRRVNESKIRRVVLSDTHWYERRNVEREMKEIFENDRVHVFTSEDMVALKTMEGDVVEQCKIGHNPSWLWLVLLWHFVPVLLVFFVPVPLLLH